MDKYCKTILKEYSAGKSILQVCSTGGMPSIVTVKKWLFNKEYDYEYKGFREAFLRIQQEMLFIYYDDLRALHNYLLCNFVEDKYGNEVICPKAKKHYYDFTIAIQWFRKHLDLLEKLYDHHARGLDFPIEGIHFEAILQQPKELGTKDPETNIERLMSALNNLGSLYLDTRTRISSSITRAEAEALLGTPLLYGRIHKKNRRKPIPRRGVLHTPSSDNEPLRQPTPTPTPNSNPNSNSNPNPTSNSNFKPRTGPIPPGLIGTKYASLYHPDPLHYDFDTTSILNLSNEPQDAAPNRKSYIVNRKSVYLSVNEFCNSQSSIRNRQFAFPSLLNSS
jgi:hypothetical protein